MKFLIAILGLMLGVSCATDYSGKIAYNAPKQTNDGIEVGTMQEVGMDTLMMAKTLSQIYNNKYDQVQSILIYKDGLLVYEEYLQGNKYKYDGPHHYGERIQWHKDSLHILMSCTKSITSACIGIAIDKGYIKSVDESIFNYLPDHQQFKTGGKENISIEHLLTMTSGLKWDEWSMPHGSPANDIDRIHWECQDDPIAGVLEQELVDTPGEKFTYNSGGTNVLGEIIKNASGINIKEFAQKYLFGPLQIEKFTWGEFANGSVICEGMLRLTSRDMLKFGISFLDNGKWKNQQIVSPEWVQKSKTNFGSNKGIRVPGSDFDRQGYTYSWWTKTLQSPKGKVDVYAASGWGGQKIIVIDDLNMVVVFTGGNYVVKNHHRKIMERYILAAIE